MSKINELLIADRHVVEAIIKECNEALGSMQEQPYDGDKLRAIVAISDEAEEWLKTVADLRACGMKALRDFRRWSHDCGLPTAGIDAYIANAQAKRDEKRKAREAEEQALAEEIAAVERHIANAGRVAHMADLWPTKKEAA